MTAVFVLGKSTREAPLLARLTAARLALPPTTRMIALLGAGASEPKPQVQRHFDELFHWKNGARSLTGYVKSDARSHTKPNDLLAAKQLHMVRWSAAYQITMLRRQHHYHYPGFHARDLVDQLALQYSQTASVAIFSHRRTSSTVVDGSQIRALPVGRSLMPSLRDAWEQNLHRTYRLDDGVPYSDEYAPLSLLLVDRWPEILSDPNKPSRTAAFGGWVMASSSHTLDVLELIERSRQFLWKKLSERTQS